MSIRAAAVCVAIVALMGCDTKEVVNTVKHQSAWQRQAGESPQETARLAEQSAKNTEELLAMLQKPEGKNPDAEMHGKLVQLEGQVIEQTDKSWTMQNQDGWTILFAVNDLTPHHNVPKDRIAKCKAQGIVHAIDTSTRKIQLDDVELLPEMKAGL